MIMIKKKNMKIIRSRKMIIMIAIIKILDQNLKRQKNLSKVWVMILMVAIT
jgi:hypothetical protein